MEISAQIMKRWWIGCSGFHYKGWKGKFYPPEIPQRLWLEHYCEHFNSLEINSSFYRYPKVEILQEWYRRSPGEFRFAVKASKFITHYRRFKEARRQTMDFYSIIERGLKDKLGCVLFQLHPDMAFSDEAMDRIAATLDKSFVNVLEFRHASWWRPTVIKRLKEEGIAFCGISHPDLPDAPAKTLPVLYYRFHGVPELYRSSYSRLQLEAVARVLKRFRGVEDIYCFFNNDIDVAAVENGKTLQQIVETNIVHQPVGNKIL